VVQHGQGLRLHCPRGRIEGRLRPFSALERAGISSLGEGQKVEYELQSGEKGKSSAENLKLVD
jgi:CspA family cold shock protein